MNSFLYVQRNARMTFVGIIEEHLLTEEHMEKLVRKDLPHNSTKTNLFSFFCFFSGL